MGLRSVPLDQRAPRCCRVAFIGAGVMAREHLRAFADVDCVELSGLYSRTRSRAEKLGEDFGVRLVCDSIAELYERTEADLVVVTVSVLETRVVSMACLDFPWAILLEKPLGYDLADAVAIRSAAKTRNHDRMFVALNRRFYSSTRVVLDDIASCGEPRLVKVQDQEDLAAALKEGEPALVVQNWMYANSIHVIDYFRILGRGRIVDVDPVVPFNTENPGAMVCVLRFESGDLGLYEGVWNAPGPWAVNVIGPNRRWELRPLERASYQDRGERETHPVEPHEWDAMFKPGLRAQAAAAVAAALGQESSLVTLDDALSTMQLVDAMFHQTPIAGKRRSLADTR